MAAAVAATALLAGCGSAVAVAPPRVSRSVAARCARLSAALPRRLEQLDTRPTSPTSPLTHAWGSPPVVLRCGVGVPAGFNAAAQVIEVNGVTWFQAVHGGSVVWTTVQRPIRVSLTVPASYADQGPFLVDLAGPVRSALPG